MLAYRVVLLVTRALPLVASRAMCTNLRSIEVEGRLLVVQLDSLGVQLDRFEPVVA